MPCLRCKTAELSAGRSSLSCDAAVQPRSLPQVQPRSLCVVEACSISGSVGSMVYCGRRTATFSSTRAPGITHPELTACFLASGWQVLLEQTGAVVSYAAGLTLFLDSERYLHTSVAGGGAALSAPPISQ